jgi:hypothetical protein
MARRRESLGNVEASKSEWYTGAGIVDSGVESERETVPIFDNGGRICMLFFFAREQEMYIYPTNTDGNTSGDVRNPTLHLRFGENCWNFLRGSSRRSQPERKNLGADGVGTRGAAM